MPRKTIQYDPRDPLDCIAGAKELLDLAERAASRIAEERDLMEARVVCLSDENTELESRVAELEQQVAEQATREGV